MCRRAGIPAGKLTAYGIDGYRCDVGDCVPLDFWREGVRRITAVRPDFVMLNEGWEDESVRGVFDLYYAGYPADIGKDTYAADVKAFAAAVHERGVEHHLTNKIENHDIASDSGLLRYERRNGHDMTDCALFMMYMESGFRSSGTATNSATRRRTICFQTVSMAAGARWTIPVRLPPMAAAA